jgi:general secretion pathway protein D
MAEKGRHLICALALAVTVGLGGIAYSQDAAPVPAAPEVPAPDAIEAAPTQPATPDAPPVVAPGPAEPGAPTEAPPAPGSAETPGVPAQVPAVTEPPAVAAPVPPAGIASPSPVPPLPAPEYREPGRIYLNFKDTTLDVILDYLSTAAGFVIVKDVEVEGRLNVVSRQALAPIEAVMVLNSVLKDKGYAAVKTGRVLRIVSLSSVKKANIPVRSGVTDPNLIEPSDEIVTQVISVQFADAVKLKQDIASLIPTYADMSSNASSNSIILTATCSDVRRVMQIVRALDTRLSEVADIKVFHLQYANASDAARLINEVFKQEDQPAQQRGGGGGANPFQRIFGSRGGAAAGGAGGTGAAAAATESGRRPPKVVASSDDRTNTLVVTGPPDTLKVVATLVNDLDSNPAADQAVFIYHLKNGQAANMQGVINSLFGSTGSTGGTSRTQQSGTRSSTGAGGGQTTTGGIRSSSSGGRSGGGTGSGSLGSSSFGGTGMGGNRSTGGSTRGGYAGGTGGGRVSAATAAAAASLAGQVYVVADLDTNSLMVMTSPNNFDRVKAIIEDLDRTSPQVLIKVLIAEVTHGSTVDLGAEFSMMNLDSNGQGYTFGTNFGVARQPLGLIYNLATTDVNAALHALETIGRLDVLSRPYILASDNQPASIMVGQSVPFITSSRVTEAGQTINTIQYQDIGIMLNVTPHINPDGLVIMDVDPEISQLTGDSVPITDTVTAPVFAKRYATSRVGIKDGQTIVIGGLIEDRKTDTVGQVPLLGSIPVLRYIFGRNQTTKSKTELLIFLTPYVAKEARDLETMSEQEKSHIKIANKAIEPGTLDEHLRNMPTVRPEEEPAGDVNP